VGVWGVKRHIRSRWDPYRAFVCALVQRETGGLDLYPNQAQAGWHSPKSSPGSPPLNVSNTALSVTGPTLTTGFSAPKSVDEFLDRYPMIIPSFVLRRAPNATADEQAEFVVRLKDYLRTPSALTDCPDRIALFGLTPGTGDPMQRFFRWVWMCLSASGVMPQPTTQDAAYLRLLAADKALFAQMDGGITR
jgi:hypothetical protein